MRARGEKMNMAVMRRGLIASLCMTLCACGLNGYPDRRASQVVVIEAEAEAGLPSLREPVALALAWWKLATHDTSTELADDCDGDHACTIVSYGGLDAGLDGQTKRWQNAFNGNNGSDVVIRPYLDEYLTRIVVAHEIGHSFSMPHVSNNVDLMYPRNVPPDCCIGPDTLRNWAAEYGDNGALVGACALDVYGLLESQ